MTLGICHKKRETMYRSPYPLDLDFEILLPFYRQYQPYYRDKGFCYTTDFLLALWVILGQTNYHFLSSRAIFWAEAQLSSLIRSGDISKTMAPIRELGDWETGDRKGGVAAMSRLYQNYLKLLRCNQLWKWLSCSHGGLKFQKSHIKVPPWYGVRFDSRQG